MAIPALSFRASVRLPSSRFQPLLSEPGVPISGTGLSSGIMRLAHGPPGRFGHAGGLRTRHGFRSAFPPRLRRAVEPVHASTTSNPYGLSPDSSWRVDSLTYACDASGIIALIAGSRHRHSRRPSSFRHRSTPEVPFLDRHYPASSVVRTSPPPRPAQPAPHGVPVGACHTTDRASRVAPIPLFHACRRQYPGGTSRCACRSLPGQWQPSPTYRRVGSRIPGFEACSAFTRVAARMVAGSP